MTIRTKYSVSQYVYFMHENRIVSMPVVSIRVVVGNLGAYAYGDGIKYTFRDRAATIFEQYISRDEKDCFSSIEELTASLQQVFYSNIFLNKHQTK